MAKAVIIDTSALRKTVVDATSYPVTSIDQITNQARITDINHNTTIDTTDYGIAKITDSIHSVKLSSILPFRVRFTNIGIPGYGPNNVPPIGIAIIGVNNYIL